nr:hypothetical protein [Methanoculleus chikugoensis]
MSGGVGCPLYPGHRRPQIVDEDGIVVDRADAEADGLGAPGIVHRVAVPVGQPHGDDGDVTCGNLELVVEVGDAAGRAVVDREGDRLLYSPGSCGYYGDAARPAGDEHRGRGSGCAGGDGCGRYAPEDRVDLERHGAVLDGHPALIEGLHGYFSGLGSTRRQPTGTARYGDPVRIRRTRRRNDQAEQDREEEQFFKIHTEIREP